MASLFQGMANPFPLPSLFFAISLASPSVFPMLSSSFVTACLHDSFGLLVFLFSWGFHLMAILVMSWFPFFKAWPNHFHFLHFLVLATCISFCPVLACSSLFMMAFSQKMPSIRQNLFVEICYSCVLSNF